MMPFMAPILIGSGCPGKTIPATISCTSLHAQQFLRNAPTCGSLLRYAPALFQSSFQTGTGPGRAQRPTPDQAARGLGVLIRRRQTPNTVNPPARGPAPTTPIRAADLFLRRA